MRSLSHEVLPTRPPRPVPDRRGPRHRRAGDDGRRRARDDRFPGIVGLGEGYPEPYYGETPETMAAVFPLLLEAVVDELTGRASTGAALGPLGAIGGRRSRWNGGAKCALDIALHDLVGKGLGLPVHELLGLSTDIPPTDFTLGIDEPDGGRRAGRPGGRLPGPQDQARRPAGPRDARGRARRLHRPDPGRRQHRLDAATTRSA